MFGIVGQDGCCGMPFSARIFFTGFIKKERPCDHSQVVVNAVKSALDIFLKKLNLSPGFQVFPDINIVHFSPSNKPAAA